MNMDKTPWELDEREKAARRAYMREYRKRNPEKTKQWEKNRWARLAAKLDEKKPSEKVQ